MERELDASSQVEFAVFGELVSDPEMFHWHYLPHPPKARRRNPVLPELFHDDDLRGVAQAVIRESIQNSLDARTSPQTPVRIRIFTSGAEGALNPTRAAAYFSSLLPHLKSAYPDSGEQIDAITKLPCPYLVIEDFGTSGLTGDPARVSQPPDGTSDNFFYFFRAEGASDKGDGKRGRWGIGKHTFFSTSRIQTFIGLTIRDQAENPGPLMMGQSISKVHRDPSNENVELEPDGWMAVDDPATWLPHSDLERISKVTDDWKLSRTIEPGLSVVIPYCDEGVTLAELLTSVLIEYSSPILDGSLEVKLESGSGETELLNTATILDVLDRLAAVEPKLDALRVLVKRMANIVAVTQSEVVLLPLTKGKPEWSREALPDDIREKFNTSLETSGYAVIRVPVGIRLKSKGSVDSESHFDVGFFIDPESKRAVFIREGIRITAVGSKAAPFTGLQPLVVIPAGALGSLLGDAEGPAHLNWDARRETFKDRYVHGAAWIDFVKHAPRRLIEFTRGMDRDPDYEIGAGWFPEPDDSGRKRRKKTRTGSPRPTPPPTTPMVLLSQVKGGFSARLNPEHPDVAKVSIVKLVMAYDRRTGNPFSRWSSADFTLADLNIVVQGCDIDESLTVRSENQIAFGVTSTAFKVSITGFDSNRDVIARAEYV